VGVLTPVTIKYSGLFLPQASQLRPRTFSSSEYLSYDEETALALVVIVAVVQLAPHCVKMVAKLICKSVHGGGGE
jgi:ABC-type siderophore export system fused ATPase/permease subunit